MYRAARGRFATPHSRRQPGAPAPQLRASPGGSVRLCGGRAVSARWHVYVHIQGRLRLLRRLVGRAQIADFALLLFGAALLVQRHEAVQDLLIFQIGGPAVSGGHGGVEFVVQLAQDANEALPVDLFLVLVQRFTRSLFFGTLYRPVMVRPSCADSRSARCASSRSAIPRISCCCASEAVGNGKGSKQSVLL